MAGQGGMGPESALAPFDEIDACLVFENVFIPNERILYAGEIEIADRINKIVNEVSRHPFCRRLEAKFGMLWQLAQTMAFALGTDKNRQVQDVIYSIGRHFATVSRLVRNAEMMPMKRSTFPTACRPDLTSLNLALDYATTHYQEIIDMLELLGGQGTVLIPSPSDLNTKVTGEYYRRFLSTSGFSVPEKMTILRLASELTASRFASRQALLEYYALGGANAMRAAVEGNLKNLYSELEKVDFKSFGESK
jgi:4-hydroxyphenylacetate 3-monooxygenase